MFCNNCGTEHDRHCPCHKQPPCAVDPAKAKFAARCPRCGNDEWFVRRSRHRCCKCCKCGFECVLVGKDVARELEATWDEQLGPLITICPECRKLGVNGGLCPACRDLRRVPPQGKIKFVAPSLGPLTDYRYNADIEQAKEAMFRSVGIPARVLDGTEERIKQKALNEPLDTGAVLPFDEKRQSVCVRCSRLAMGSGGVDWVCLACRVIEKADAPAGEPADAGIRVGFFEPTTHWSDGHKPAKP